LEDIEERDPKKKKGKKPATREIDELEERDPKKYVPRD
jgi:hypothetical protein